MTKILDFKPERVFLNRAARYIDNPGLLIDSDEKKRAVPTLVRAIRLGDIELRKKIVMLLGSFACDDAVHPLYDIIRDEFETDEMREQAALNINTLGPFLTRPNFCTDLIAKSLKKNAQREKALAILAIGWENNHRALTPILEMLNDFDDETVEMAILSLGNIMDSYALEFLDKKFKTASLEHKRAIIYSIWRFCDRSDDVMDIYRRELIEGDERLIKDILIVLDEMEYRTDHIPIYRKYLHDDDSEIRALSLERLAGMDEITQEELFHFLNDPSMKVKRTAINLLKSTR